MISSALSIAVYLWLVTILSPLEMGIVTVGYALYFLLFLFKDFGLTPLLISSETLTQSFIDRVFSLRIVVLCILSSVGVAAAFLLPVIYGLPELRIILLLVTSTLFIEASGFLSGGLLLRELRFHRLATADVSSVMVASTATVVVALLGYPLYSLFVGMVVGGIARTVILVMVRPCRASITLDCVRDRRLVSAGSKLFMIRIMAYAVLNINVFVLAKVDLASAGFYGFAMQLVNKPTDMGILVLNRVLLPAYSALARSGGALMNALRKTTRLISIPAFGTFTALFSISPLLITFLYGAEWEESILLAQILVSYGLLRMMSEPASNLLISVGAPGAYLKVYALALSVQLVFLLPLMSVFGNATGCALDMVLSFAVHAIALFYTVSRRFGTPISAVAADISAVLVGAPLSIVTGYVVSSILSQALNWWVFLAISMLTFISFLSAFARADMLKTASYARESLALVWQRGS